MFAFVQWKCGECGFARNAGMCDACKQCGKARVKRGNGGDLKGHSTSKKVRGDSGRYKMCDLADGWKSAHGGSVLFRGYGDVSIKRDKIAAFDFDGTLCQFEFWQKYKGDIRPHVVYPNVLKILKKLNASGYRLVIFSNELLARLVNENAIAKQLAKKTQRVDDFLRFVDLPMEVYLATGYDSFRKPCQKDRDRHGEKCGGIGMWSFMLTQPLRSKPVDLQVDMQSSFFVGDAAGRSGDQSDCDKMFASNVGLEFFTPEGFFCSTGKGDMLLNKEKEEVPIDFDLAAKNLTLALSKTPKRVILLTVGLPGSGKSTFAKALVKLSDGISRVSQDVLHKKEKVKVEMDKAFSQGAKIVIIDRTNLTIEQREYWLKAGDFAVFAVYFDLNQMDCVIRCERRTNHEGKFPTDRKKIKDIVCSRLGPQAELPPKVGEGFQGVLTMNGNHSQGALLMEFCQWFCGVVGNVKVAKRLRCIFSSLSTGDFKFDPKRAANVLLKTAERWMNDHPELELVLLEPPQSRVLEIISSDPRQKHLSTQTGSLVDFGGNALAIGVGCTHRLSVPGENTGNIQIGNCLTKPVYLKLVNDQVFPNAIAKVGVPYKIQLPAGNNLHCDFMVLVRGPNMNPEREDCLGGEYEVAEAQLETCYLKMFETFLELSKRGSTLKRRKYQKPTCPAPKCPKGFEWALYDYLPLDLPASHKPFIYVRNEDYVVIYDAFPKARTHLLVLPLARSGLDGLNAVSELGPQHVRGLDCLLTFVKNLVKELKETDDDAPLQVGFHRVPSLKHLHLHIISKDFDSPSLKNKKHWNSFTNEYYFVGLSQVLESLRDKNQRIQVDHDKITAALKGELKCHRCSTVLKTIPNLRSHIACCKSPFSDYAVLP